MKCPICGKDVELQKKQVGLDELGEPVFNQYAICKDCKKQWNLDKQRAKKAASQAKPTGMKSPVKAAPATEGKAVAKPAAKKTAVSESAAKPAAKKTAVSEGTAKPAAKKTAVSKGTVKPAAKKPAAGNAAALEKTGKPAAKKVSAENPAKTTVKKAPAKKAAGRAEASDAAPVKKKAAPKQTKPITIDRTETASARTAAKTSASGKTSAKKTVPVSEEQRYGNIPSEKVREKKERAVKKGYEDMLSTDPGHKQKKKKPAPEKIKEPELEEEFDDTEEVAPRFRGVRVVLSILSILAFAYFTYMGFLSGLDNIAAGGESSAGITYIVLAICMLISGLLLLIMQKRNTIFAFLLPMIFYLGSAVYAFLNRAGDSMLLYGAIAGAVLAVIFLILAIVSRGQDDDEEYDDYDDPFEDDFE